MDSQVNNLITQRKILIDADVAEQIIDLFKRFDVDNVRTTPREILNNYFGVWYPRKVRTNPYAWFDATFARVQEAIGDDLEINEWWFNCYNYPWQYNWHTHIPHMYAAILYILTPENCGGIQFKSVEESNVYNPQNVYTHHPSVGDFLLFPATLPHRVQRNASQNYRIMAAFNLIPKYIDPKSK